MDRSVSGSRVAQLAQSARVVEAPHRSGTCARGQRRRALALAAAACAWLPLQSPPPPSPPSSGPTAKEILARAIEAQGLPPSANPAADLPLALHAKVNLEFKTEKGDVLSIDVERKFLGEKGGPGRIWTRAVPTSDRERETILAFDGTKPWFWSRQAGLRWLDEPGMENDRRQLERDLETTALLARASLLRNLPSQLEDLKRLDDESGHGLTAWVIEGRAKVEREGETKPVTLRLWFVQPTAWLFGARVMVEGEPPLQICFTKHERVGGVVVPGKIELYWNDEKTPRETFRVDFLKLAPPLDPNEFAPPKS